MTLVAAFSRARAARSASDVACDWRSRVAALVHRYALLAQHVIPADIHAHIKDDPDDDAVRFEGIELRIVEVVLDALA